MRSDSIVSPEDQKVTFVELFFDLVFVFSVTQTVGLFHNGVTWAAVGRAVLVFWLVWWAWTQYTWALNAADTTHTWIEVGVLAATAVAFFMAVALPFAFEDRSAWFGLTYVLVRVIGLALYAWVASSDPLQRAAVRRFALVSTGGLVAVLIGSIAGGSAQLWLWGLAILLDVIAAAVGGRAEGWNLHPEHFSERHGLFVIIALGETLIVAAGGVTGALGENGILILAILAVALTGAFWWSYFPRSKPILDHALESSQGSERSGLARDVFSLLHFPMLCGVVAYAVTVEEAVAHPGEPLTLAVRAMLAAGLVLFVGGMALAIRRASRRTPWSRLLLAVITSAVIVLLDGMVAALSFVIAFGGVIIILVVEQTADKDRSKL